MLYFADPELKKRSDIPPPTDFIAIENGEIVQQRHADRTPNAISQPETLEVPASPNGPLSAIEKAFLEELTSNKSER